MKHGERELGGSGAGGVFGGTLELREFRNSRLTVASAFHPRHGRERRVESVDRFFCIPFGNIREGLEHALGLRGRLRDSEAQSPTPSLSRSPHRDRPA